MVAMELLGKNKEELRAYCRSLGEPAYRGAQLYHALYAERNLNISAMTNLPASFRQKSVFPRETHTAFGET